MIEHLTQEALDDLREAGRFYENQRSGLGFEFAYEVGRSIATIAESPKRWPEIEPGVHKFRLKRFPFAILYETDGSRGFAVLAIFDQRRRPGSWKRNSGDT